MGNKGGPLFGAALQLQQLADVVPHQQLRSGGPEEDATHRLEALLLKVVAVLEVVDEGGSLGEAMATVATEERRSGVHCPQVNGGRSEGAAG